MLRRHALQWIFLILVCAYIALVLHSYPHYQKERVDASAIAKIQDQKITRSDVDGIDRPPTPDPAIASASVAGVDENENGIRDDVELAIFSEYPTSTLIRAAELQYAKVLQTMLTDVFDDATWKAAAIQKDRAYQCIGGSYPRTDTEEFLTVTNARSKEVESLVVNTSKRQAALDEVSRFTTSYQLSDANFCDIDPATLQ